jgi:hypothetical protein
MPNVNKVEAITFSVGVEQAYNHLDPASFPPDDPLAPNVSTVILPSISPTTNT